MYNFACLTIETSGLFFSLCGLMGNRTSGIPGGGRRMVTEDLKVAVLGPEGTGKSALVVQFVQGIFVQKYDPTIDDSYRKLESITETKHLIFEVFDSVATHGDLYRSFVARAKCFLLCYSLEYWDNPNTFEVLAENLREVDNVCTDPDRVVVVVGTKSDLFSNDPDTTVGAQFARREGFHHVITASKTGSNINAPFVTAAKVFFGLEPRLHPQITTKSANKILN